MTNMLDLVSRIFRSRSTRILAIASISALLAGCVLDSKQPAFTDAQSELVLGSDIAKIEPWSLEDGKWVKGTDGDQMLVKVEGNHYAMTNTENGKTAQMAFLALDKDHYAVQFSEKVEGYMYGVGQWDGQEFSFKPILCLELDKAAPTKGIVIEGDNCHLDVTGDVKSTFSALSATKTTYKLKMIPKS